MVYRLSDTGKYSMVIDQAIYSRNNDALDDFQFVMAICTGKTHILILLTFY